LIEWKIDGGKQLADLMAQLPVEVETKILRNALAEGAIVIRDKARALAPKKTGGLRRAIVTSRGKPREGQVVVKVRLRRGRGWHGALGHLMEYGVAAHQIWVHSDKVSLVINGVPIGKHVTHPGFAPKPFMRPALDAKAGEAVQAVAGYLTHYLQWGSFTPPTVPVDLEEAA
jgi:HK97 gp10 family phage protein